MNKTKVIEALEEAKAEEIHLIKNRFYQLQTNGYCVVGWLACKAGMSPQDVSIANFSAARSDLVLSKVCSEYAISLQRLRSVIGLNDKNWTSWDMVIRYFEGITE